MDFNHTAKRFSMALLFAGVSHGVLAGEAEDVAEAFSNAISQGNEIDVTYDSAVSSGGSVTIENLKITEPETGNVVTIAETVLTGAAKNGSGDFDVAEITMQNGTMSGDGDLSIASATITDAVLLSDETVESGELDTAIVYDTLSLEALSLVPPDQDQPITVEKVFFDADTTDDYRFVGGTGKVDAINLPLALFDDATTKPSDLGYETVVIDASWSGGVDHATSIMDIENMVLSLRDGGTLSLSGKLGNFPEKWPSTDGGPAAMAPLAALTVDSLALSYEDNSLAGRILEQQAKAQGMSREQFSQQMAAALPFLLNVLNNPPFQAEVAKAVGTFLGDPKSLNVTANPETPVTGAELFGLVAASPQALPDRLNISIVANGSD